MNYFKTIDVMRKAFFLFLASAVCTLIFFGNPVKADQKDNPVNINQYTQNIAANSGYATAGVSETSFSQAIGRVIRLVLSLIGVIFLALTVYAGFLWMTAGGNAEQVEKAQNIVRMGVMGLIIIVGCYGIVVFILAAVTAVTNTENTSVGKIF